MKKIITFSAMMLLLVHSVFAQIEGTVSDRKGRGLAGVAVDAINNLGNAVATSLSDDRGYFSFSGLLPGKYKIKVMAGGFRTVVFKNIEVKEGDKGPPGETEDYFIRNRLRAVLSTDMTHYQVEGQVIGEKGKSQPNVSVSITDTTEKVIATIKSDDLGFFGFKDLRPGKYQIEAKPPGFRRAVYYVTVKDGEKEAAGELDMAQVTWLYVVLRPAK